MKEGYLQTYPILLQAFKDLAPDVVIVESVSIACVSAATTLNIPIVMSGAAWPNEPWISFFSRWKDLPFTASSARVPLKALGDLWDFVTYTGWHFAHTLWYQWSHELPLTSEPAGDLELMTFFTPLWPNAYYAPKVKIVGPVVNLVDEDKEIERSTLEFLEVRKKVVLFAMGQYLQFHGDEREVLINALKDAHDQGLIDGVIWGKELVDKTLCTQRVVNLNLSGNISHSRHGSHVVPFRPIMAETRSMDKSIGCP